MTTGRYLVQIKNPDGMGWLDVAARDSWEAAEAFAECRQRMTGHEHRAALLPKIDPPHAPYDAAEGHMTQERA